MESTPTSPRVSRRRALVIVAGAASATILPAGTARARGSRFPGPGDTFLGMTYDDRHAVEQDMDRRHRIARFFKGFDEILTPDVRQAMSEGRLPIVSFKPEGYSHQQVARGAIDGYLRRQRKAIRRDGRNLIVNYTPEPESVDEAARFGGGVPREELGPIFGKAWRHVLDVMHGPPNLKFTMCFTGGMIQFDWVQRYWVPDRRVSYLSSDPYNWCPGSGHGTGSEEFSEIVRPTMSFAREVGKPILLLEMASFAKSDPAFRAGWIDRMGRYLARHDRIRGIVWFENSTHCDWRLSRQAASVRAWDRQLARFGHV